MVNHEWFELRDIRKRNFSKCVWIPLRAAKYNIKEGEFGYEGYKEEFFGSGSIAVPTEKIDDVKKLGWMDIGISHQHRGYVEDGDYISAELYKDYKSELTGLHLVLEQALYDKRPNPWHLNQDLVLTLGLIREGNLWLRPKDGYAKVARLEESEERKPLLLEIKSQYLKDYLCAREMALYMTHYFIRDQIVTDASSITWKDECLTETNTTDRWEARVLPIHEGGQPYGQKVAVFHVERTDVDESDDVPDISGIPTDENTKGDSWERAFEGKKLFRIVGELWRNEVIEPGKHSPVVRGDDIPIDVKFIIDAEGTRVCGKDLIGSGKWLWFKPEVMMPIYHRRGGSLSWYSAQTGSVSCSYGDGVHFGINGLGLINVYAKDVGLLPEWQQQIWAGYNTAPEGGVSNELLASQVRATPAETSAPEDFLGEAIKQANALTEDKFEIRIFR